MDSTDPQHVAWHVELLSSGQVCVDVSRVRAGVYFVTGVLLTALFLGCLFVPGVAVKVIACLLLPIMVGMVVMSVQQLLRVGSWASPVVVVDAEGIDVRHGLMRVPWSQTAGAIAYCANTNRWVVLVVSAEFLDTWTDQRGTVQRVLVRLTRSLSRRQWSARVNLPPNLRVDTEAFASWITAEAQARTLAQA